MRKRTFKACICSRNAAISAAMSGGGRSGTGRLNRAADRPFLLFSLSFPDEFWSS
jgi:hypothetical protein